MGSLSALDILVVEDNDSVRNAIAFLLKKSGFSVDAANSGGAALCKLNERYFDLVISDYKMPNMDGIQLLTRVKERWPATEVIIITAFGSISKGVEAIKLGAFDYITKPFDNEVLLGLVQRFVEEQKAAKHSTSRSEGIRQLLAFSSIVGNSVSLISLLEMVAKVANKDSTILISGESGTGKELIARSIHDLSHRKNEPFVALNCGAITDTLLESELFGHKRGAFTSADSNKKGLIEVADGGTIFLDEIGEMSAATQVKLLRFLQEGEIRRVGDSSTINVDVRVISATNKSLGKEVKSGKFREDLYYRINVIPLLAPALRERREDIPLLVEHFIRKYGDQGDGSAGKISRRAMSMLMNYHWPGNVRELENVVHRCVALAIGPELVPEQLPDEIRLRDDDDENGPHARNLAEIERKVILETLKRMHGNRQKTARELGISKTTLWRKLKDTNAS